MIFKTRYALLVNAGRSVYQSQRTIAESSNYDDESHGQGASILQLTLETCKQIPARINSPTFVNSNPPANTTEVLWNSAVLWRTNWTYSP